MILGKINNIINQPQIQGIGFLGSLNPKGFNFHFFCRFV